jgi:hypothetical protein
MSLSRAPVPICWRARAPRAAIGRRIRIGAGTDDGSGGRAPLPYVRVASQPVRRCGHHAGADASPRTAAPERDVAGRCRHARGNASAAVAGLSVPRAWGHGGGISNDALLPRGDHCDSNGLPARYRNARSREG